MAIAEAQHDTADSSLPERFTRLRTEKLGNVRATFSPVVYARSNLRAYGILAFDAAFFIAAIAGVALSTAPALKLFFGVLAGVAVSALFVWAHDAAHGALFGFTRQAELVGTIAMLPSLNMYRMWMYGHNKAHHGFTSFAPIDWIWRPKTPAEYHNGSRWSRLVYRIERSLPGCALHYILRVWWPGMVAFRPDREIRRKHHFAYSQMWVATYLAVATTLAWMFAGGLLGVVAAVIVPWVVFNYHIALFVFLHHTHPDLPMFDKRAEWSAPIGQVACSTMIRMSPPMEFLMHGILIHTPHHVDTRIPFYRLRQAYADLQPTFGEDILEYRFRWSTVRSIFGSCQLYDFDTHTWYRFDNAPTLPLPHDAH